MKEVFDIIQVKKKIVARVASPRGDAKRKGRIMYERTRTLLETMKKREKLYLDTVRYSRIVTMKDLLLHTLKL